MAIVLSNKFTKSVFDSCFGVSKTVTCDCTQLDNQQLVIEGYFITGNDENKKQKAEIIMCPSCYTVAAIYNMGEGNDTK